MDLMPGSSDLSNTSVSGIQDCHPIQNICRRRRWWNRSSPHLELIQHPRFTCIQDGRQNTCFIDHDFCFEFDTILGPNTFIKTWSVLRLAFFPFNVYGWFYVGQSRHWVVYNNVLFQTGFWTKGFICMRKTVHETLPFIVRMRTMSLICIKQLPNQRRGNFCVCQQSTDIVFFTRRSISNVDTIRIFRYIHNKNYCEVDGKQCGCRNVTLFDPIINRYFVGESSTKTNSSLHPVMKRSNQCHKFLGTTQLQQNLPQSGSIHSIKRFWQVNETVI